MINNQEVIETTYNYISDYALLIKKMRLLRKLTRQQAALLHFNFGYQLIEKLENGRGPITVEKFRLFQSKYGFSDSEVEAIRNGEIVVSEDANSIRKRITTEERKDRRFCHRRITRECKVLKEMRLMRKLDQCSASRLCKFNIRTIGFIENGRIVLDDQKIRFIVEKYGYSMEFFYQLLRTPQLHHELIEMCTSIIQKMDENKLRMILPMLNSMSN